MQENGLISALGGSLGLFTGIAVIMLFEVLELAWDLAINVFRYLNPRPTSIPAKLFSTR
jgi:hypothetical protein